MNWAAEKGIVNGTTVTTFAPDDDITREQTAAILARTVQNLEMEIALSDQTFAPYLDAAAISSWAEEPVAYCRRAGLMQGDTGGTFRPGDPVSRCEGMVVLVRLVQNTAQTDETTQAVEAAIRQGLSGAAGDWAVTYCALDTDQTVTVCGGSATPEGEMVSASLIKLWVMATVYDQVEKGALTLNNTSRLYLHYMITISDNSSTNRLINLLGGGSDAAGMALVNQYAASIGCTHTHLNRKMLASGTENYTTSQDCARILKLIWNGECVSSAASQEMLSLLKQQTDLRMIPKGLSGTGAVTYSKTGELAGGFSRSFVEHDAAIVVPKSGSPYILCVMSSQSSVSANAKALTVGAGVSTAVYNALK